MQHSLYYLSTIDKYLGHSGIFSPSEVEEMDRQEKIWKDSQKNYSIHELLEIFPEAKPVALKTMKHELVKAKDMLNRIDEFRKDYNNRIMSRVSAENKWFYSAIRDTFFLSSVSEDNMTMEPLADYYEKRIKKLTFLISGLKGNKEIKKGAITEADIDRAKQIPIENLYVGHLKKTGSTLVGKCPLHQERTGSFTIYTKTNRWWCFGENIGGDVIDLVSKTRNVEFLDAVKILLNK